MKKKNLYDNDDFDEEEAEEETEGIDEEEEEEEVPKKFVKPKKKVRQMMTKAALAEDEEEVETEGDKNWLVQRIPELLRVVDPQTKKVITQAYTVEELTLQLQVLATQFASEAARNTR